MNFRKYLRALTLVIIFQSGLICSSFGQSTDITRLTNKQFKKAAKKENVIILDVRTPEEFKEGHLENALLINYNQTDTFLKQVQALDSTKTYLLYCRSGKRSYNAAVLMKEKGFLRVSDLKDGISKWDGPTVKGSQ